MATKHQDVSGQRENGQVGNGPHTYGGEDVERGERQEGRYYVQARGRDRDREREDHLLGMGYARSSVGRGRERQGSEFEHGREGFRDFGTPSYAQGRELRERYSERDFQGRDDRFAGRSGLGYRSDEELRSYRVPEEEWERTHYRGRAEEGRGRLWSREPSVAQDIMTRNPRTVRPDATLREVAEIMRDEDTGIVPVVARDNKLVGLITDRDMVMRTFTEDRSWTTFRAHEVMSDEIEAVTPEEPVREIIHLMGRKQVRRVPVVDRQDRLLGMIAMADVATRADMDDDLQQALDRVSKRRSFWSRLWR